MAQRSNLLPLHPQDAPEHGQRPDRNGKQRGDDTSAAVVLCLLVKVLIRIQIKLAISKIDGADSVGSDSTHTSWRKLERYFFAGQLTVDGTIDSGEYVILAGQPSAACGEASRFLLVASGRTSHEVIVFHGTTLPS